MTSEALREFGFAVRKARLDLGWSLEELASQALGNSDRKGYVSQVEKGKRNLRPETIDKFDQALTLPADVVKAALIGPPPETEETPQDRNAERLLRIAARDEATPATAEALIIALAYEFAPGKTQNLETAYNGLRIALKTAASIKAQGAMPRNTSDQIQRIMQEVARLNDSDEREAAADYLAEEMKRLESERDTVFELQLDQDRLLNRPDAAAKRLIAQLRQTPQPGGLWQANHDLLHVWRERGERDGDPFDLRVALALAKANHDRAKRGQKGLALSDLGHCYLGIGERAGTDGPLKNAIKAFRLRLKAMSRHTEPENWAGTQGNLGNALSTLGERGQDPARLRDAIAAHEAALEVFTRDAAPEDWAMTQNNLGNALRAFGDREQDPARVRDAIAAYEAALEVYTRDAAPMNWATTQHNLAIAFRSLAQITSDSTLLDQARLAYDNALLEHTRDNAPHSWADTTGGLGELELDRFELDGDRTHLAAARTFIDAAAEIMKDANEVLAARCDELLARIDAAEAG